MKRSKMVKMLTDQFIGRGMASDLGAKVAANEILTFLEKRGMLPPGASFKGTNEGCLCTMRESCSSCGGYNINEWEPEK